MTEEDFISALIKRHNSADTDSVTLKDIGDVVRNLTDATRRELFEWYKETWRSNSCPRAAYFSDRLRETGKKSGFGRNNILNGAFICKACGLKYSLKSQGCPVCGENDVAGIYPDGAHPSIREVKTDCWICSIYHDSDGLKYGPECREWGSGKTPFDYCRDCRCRPCCIYEYNYRRGTAGDKMPWININHWRKKDASRQD